MRRTLKHKIRIITIILFVLVSQSSFSQDYTPKNNGLGAIISKNMVIYKNGDTLDIKKVSTPRGKSAFLKVTLLEKNRKIKIPAETVEKVIWLYSVNEIGGKLADLHFNTWRFVKLRDKLVLAAELVDGKCSLYFKFGINKDELLVQRTNETATTVIHSGLIGKVKFTKGAADYFVDCFDMVSLVKESNTKDMLKYIIPKSVELVSFYNEKCGAN